MANRLMRHPLVDGVVPVWASGIGDDRFGVFADVAVGEVQFRLRWVPGGRFVMGSPTSEAGRVDNEEQHVVELSGYWLGETPVTQALWVPLMGGNPSRFQHPRRPVEGVSWDDCQEFLQRLNKLVPGLSGVLPTEAQWEYACRSGTTTATYAGDIQIVGDRNAPVLDRIAWYGGNSGRGFLQPNGEDSSRWPEKQYPHQRAGTRFVREKTPNGFGLYDMLGNVYEWCADWYGPYPKDLHRDPRGPDVGDLRVLRGGSWISDARNVRAAHRAGDPPSYRLDDIGCRLSRGQDQVWAAEPPPAEPAVAVAPRQDRDAPNGARGEGFLSIF